MKKLLYFLIMGSVSTGLHAFTLTIKNNTKQPIFTNLNPGVQTEIKPSESASTSLLTIPGTFNWSFSKRGDPANLRKSKTLGTAKMWVIDLEDESHSFLYKDGKLLFDSILITIEDPNITGGPGTYELGVWGEDGNYMSWSRSARPVFYSPKEVNY